MQTSERVCWKNLGGGERSTIGRIVGELPLFELRLCLPSSCLGGDVARDERFCG